MSGRIGDLWIEQNYRRRGLVKNLVSELVGYFKLNDFVSIILQYSYGNAEAKAFWDMLGFELVLSTAAAILAELDFI